MNVTGKYLKVWKVKESNGYTRLDLGDSQKKKDGTYDNCTWFDCALFGSAAEKTFYEGDVVEITSGMIFMEKYNDKWYPKVKIFHIQKMETQNTSNDFRGNVQGTTESPAATQNKPASQGFSSFKAPPKEEPTPDRFEDDIPF